VADNTPLNGQITDAVTQANVKVLGDAPAMAMGSIFQSLAHSTGILYQNAVSAQQQNGITSTPWLTPLRPPRSPKAMCPTIC